ncbi:GMC oxidoreductase [Luteimonas terricola]|uniref:GMC oxidoreductase n=1 Tax=Luteimonas terricola TaxID=645597 RepID=A0ABQ2EFE1_9GAMM|nr:GMC oxidoreductase [Luteimonas terricola]GGK09409.1 GMC oxidoreductase [Luteimonas terricola]
MILDYLDPSAPDNYQCDICIIGAGPAGIAIASAFENSRFSVCVLESGGLESERMTQALNDGESVGPVDFDPGLCRLRALGGSSRLWGGGCVPLARLDMAPRDWVPSSGWPIDFDELAVWGGHARNVFGIDPRHDVGDGGFGNADFVDSLPLREEHTVQRVCFLSPVMFQSRYRELFENAANITLLLHANLTELVAATDADHVRAAEIGSLAGRRGVVHARHYVLATGGIENARLLLQSNRIYPRGLGNRHDQVGRYFMDHPRCVAGRVVDGDLHALLRPYDSDDKRRPHSLYREFALADAAQRQLRLLNARARPIPVADTTPPGLQALRDLRASFRPAAGGDDVEDKVERALSAGLPKVSRPAPPGNVRRAHLVLRMGMNAGHVAGAVARKLRNRPVDSCRHVDLMAYFEQSPNPDSRITLADSRDAMGMRKVRVDWRFTDLDYASYRTAASVLGDEAARCCGGRFEPEPWVRDPALRPAVMGTAHHIGTTRMSARPEDGVVDRDCKVHGMENLHVAGSSVFPTGGWAFPTFTIVALAMRLADRLRTGLEIVGV